MNEVILLAFELGLQDDLMTVYLVVTHNGPQGTFCVAQAVSIIDSDITGITSYSNERIREIGWYCPDGF